MVAETRIGHCSSATAESPVPVRTVAELLRDLGVDQRRRIRHGAGTGRVSLPPQSLHWGKQLALGFVSLKPSVQLRAMVEDWSLQRIQEAVRAEGLETLGPQERDPKRVGPHRAADRQDQHADFRQPGLLVWLLACGLAAGLVAAGIIGGLR